MESLSPDFTTVPTFQGRLRLYHLMHGPAWLPIASIRHAMHHRNHGWCHWLRDLRVASFVTWLACFLRGGVRHHHPSIGCAERNWGSVKRSFPIQESPNTFVSGHAQFVLWQRTNARGSCMTAPGMPPAGTGPRRQAEEARQATPPGRPTLCIDLKPGERSAGVRTPDPRTPWRALRSSARWHATRGTTEPKAPRSGPSIREAPSPAPPLYRAAGGTPQ